MKTRTKKLTKNVEKWLKTEEKKTKVYRKEFERKPYWKKLGQVYVESGSLLIADCIDMRTVPKQWPENEHYGLQIGKGDGVLTRTGWGDGTYEVWAKIVKCRVAEVKIKFI